MKYPHYAKLSFYQSTAYRFSMLLSLLLGPFNLVIQYFIWSALLSLQETIAGYDITLAMTYFTAATLISYFIYNGVHNQFDELVIRGGLTRELLRPIDLIKQLFFSALGNRSMAFLLEILPIMIAIGFIFGFETLIPQNTPLFIAGLIVAFVINYLWGYLFGLSSFWTKRTHGLKLVSFSLFLIATGFSFPLDILPHKLQVISSYLFFEHVMYAPIKYFTGDFALGNITDAYLNLAIGVMWAVVLWVLCKYLQKKAYDKYQGVGQ